MSRSKVYANARAPASAARSRSPPELRDRSAGKTAFIKCRTSLHCSGSTRCHDRGDRGAQPAAQCRDMQALRRGPRAIGAIGRASSLHGVPFLAKDLFVEIAGTRTEGAAFLQHRYQSIEELPPSFTELR